MKVIVTSDTHGDLLALKKVYEMNKDADLFIDAGDSELKEEDLVPFKSVKGNCDVYLTNNFRVDEVGGVTFFTTHGNGLFFTNSKLSSMARDVNAQVAIHGHTHIPEIVEKDGVKIVCPGSVSRPKGNSRPSYAQITFSNKNDIDIKIIELL